jgi:hypothetical protein
MSTQNIDLHHERGMICSLCREDFQPADRGFLNAPNGNGNVSIPAKGFFKKERKAVQK